MPEPHETLCDGLDDDMDGQIDEDWPVPCEVQEPHETLCDGLDDDMDGLVDEDFDIDGDGQVRCCEPGAFFAAYTKPATPGDLTHIDAYMHDTGNAFTWESEVAGLVGQPIRINALADFDDDGSTEILWYNRNTLERYATSCQASPGASQGEWMTESWSNWSLNGGDYFAGGLVNDDQCVDLVGWQLTRDPATNYIVSLQGFTALGNCDGTFNELPDTFSANVAGEWIADYNYNIKDIDGDGSVDFTMQSYSTGGASTTKLYYLHGNGNGYFGAPVALAVANGQPQNSGDVLDIDGDGLVELVGGADDDGDKGLSLLWDDLLANTPPVPLVDTCVGPSGDYCAGASRLYDWNNDGFPDLLTGHALQVGVTAEINYWDNNGGVFSPAPTLVAPGSQLPFVGFMVPLTIP